MAILTVNQLNLNQGGFQLLDNAMFNLEPRERVALIGRNGEGKSSFLKILAGELKPDGGKIEMPTGIDIAMLSQTLLPADNQTIYDVVAKGLTHLDEEDWRLQHRIDKIMHTLNLPGDALMSTLSGGWLRRVAIAQVLVREPDILLLDEPTNHLDLNTIQWLEQCLLNYPKSILFITHDRAMLRKIATRIIELDRGKLRSYPGDYDLYLIRKEKELEDEEKANTLFDKRLSQEEVWIRQGIKARRTRNEGRVRNLEKLRLIRKARREQAGDPKFAIHAAQTESKVLIKAQNLSFAYPGQQPLFESFSITIRAGDKIALIGPNGAGKTTLVNVLLGNLSPTTGILKLSDTLKTVVFDQHRAQIDLNKSVIDNVVEGSDMIEVNGKQKHIVSYLNDFLFSPEKSRRKASMLSGGEINRLLLAKIFSKPANLLVLDEPTNDLDVESLEVLESILQQYEGTVIIISHDREFIDNVATHSIVFEGDPRIKTYVGGYSDWEWQRTEPRHCEEVPRRSNPVKNAGLLREYPRNDEKKSTSRELSTLIKKIEKLESQIAQIHETMGQPDFYQQPKEMIQQKTDQLAKIETELEQAYAKFEELS